MILILLSILRIALSIALSNIDSSILFWYTINSSACLYISVYKFVVWVDCSTSLLAKANKHLRQKDQFTKEGISHILPFNCLFQPTKQTREKKGDYHAC